MPGISRQAAPDPALPAVYLCLQLGLSWALPSPAQVAAICRSLCSSCRWASGKTQVVADLDLRLPGGPRAMAPGTASEHIKHHPTTSTSNTLKGQTHQAPEPA